MSALRDRIQPLLVAAQATARRQYKGLYDTRPDHPQQAIADELVRARSRSAVLVDLLGQALERLDAEVAA